MGLLLATIPALMMTNPYRLSGFLVAVLVCAALSGCAGTLVAGRLGFLAGIRVVQELAGGGVAALLFWVLMAIAISGFTLRNPIELSLLIEPDVFMGSFLIALSAVLCAFVGGLLLGPIFGTFVKRAVRKNAGDDPGGKEDLVCTLSCSG